MPTPDRPPLTRAVVLRGIGFAAAIALGAVAVWLTVTSDSQKSLRIGMLVGLWGLLLGAYSMFGARRGMGVEADDDPGREIAVREHRNVLERSDDADARRDWEARLERLISREISTAVGRETAALRNEIAHLRQELVDKVGGQLRLERIETTRVIGSDLEALQDEVRQLKHASGSQTVHELLVASNDPRLAVRPVVEPARVRPISRPTAEVEADIRPAVRPEAAAETPVESPPVAQPQRQTQPPAAPLARGDDSAQRAPVSHAAAQAAQARIAGAAGSQLGGQRRTEQQPATTPPATASQPPAASLQPAAQGRSQRPPVQQPPVQQPLVQQPPAQQPAAQQPPAQQPAARAKPAEPPPPLQPARPQQPAARQSPPVQPNRPQQPAADRSPAVPPPVPATPAADPADPFASLPRLSRFTDFELDPVDTTDTASKAGNGHANGSRHGNGNGTHQSGNASTDPSDPTQPNYTGRRRRSGEPDGDTVGDHSSDAPADTVSPARGGRRRRDDDGDDGSELLARLLARESSADHR